MINDGKTVVQYFKSIIPPEAANALFEICRNSVCCNREGDRFVKWFAKKDYVYGGRTHEACEVPDFLRIFIKCINLIFKSNTNSVLCNRYPTGNFYIPFHKDNEALFGVDPTIVSVSLGAKRDFILRGSKEVRVSLEHGSVLVMAKKSQTFWKHGILKDPYCKKERINLTFRKVL